MSDEGALAEALITTRDGIVGPWKPPTDIPEHNKAEHPYNLLIWEPWVSETVFEFELASRLGFSASVSGVDATVSVWHLKLTPGVGDAPPVPHYLPLVRFDRPLKEIFEAQLKFMRSYADLRPDRATEILEQMDGPAPFIASIAFLRPENKRWTLMLLDMVMELARLVEHRVKHGLACRRPIEYSPQVQPIIPTPGHGSLPSGHATEAFASAFVLRRLLRASGKDPYSDSMYGIQLMRLASRIAINRTVAGVHFPIDSIAGAMLGLTLGDYFIARVGSSDKIYQPTRFEGNFAGHVDGPKGIKERDFLWQEIFDLGTGTIRFFGDPEKTHPSVHAWGDSVNLAAHDSNGAVPADIPSAAVAWLWEKAVAEWK